jgi:hypothetical protein
MPTVTGSALLPCSLLLFVEALPCKRRPAGQVHDQRLLLPPSQRKQMKKQRQAVPNRWVRN